MTGAGTSANGSACPRPASGYAHVVLGHGGGGRLMQRLIDDVFVRAFASPELESRHDGAVLRVAAGRIAVTTDTFVVTPRWFPGGDLGSLAVHGTVNDLAMCGARPIALTAGFVLEEGLAIDELERLVGSMAAAARDAGVPIVTGDTKVVDRGRGDGVFVNTTGIGVVPDGVAIAPVRAEAGDVVLVSGTLGDHGVAVMAAREGLGFEPAIRSDSAALHDLVAALLAALGEDVHVLRDPTRGGAAAALDEIARAAGLGVEVDESRLPVTDPVRAACELLGLDPLHVANEGKLLAFVPVSRADEALDVLRAHPLGRAAARIGGVVAEHPGRVLLHSRIGGRRLVDLPSGEQLPRIC